MVLFDKTKIMLLKESKICVLTDPFYGALKYSEPVVSQYTFKEFYDSIEGEDDSGDYLL